MANFAPSPPETRGGAAAPQARPRDMVGDLLRRTRDEQGGDIDSIGATLRIRAAYLVAIEEARYDRLPGPVYALGFVRSYANHLGLDGDEAVRRFKLEAAGLEQRRDLAFPMPLTPRSIPGGRMLLVAFVLAVCAYGIWHYLSTDRARPERVAAVPADLMPPPPSTPAPAPNAPPSAADASAAPPPPAAAAPADETAAASPSPTAAAPAPVPVTAVPLPPPAPSGSLVAPPAPGTGPAPSGLNVAANAPPPPAASPSPAPAVTVAAAPPDATPAADVSTPSGSGAHVFGAIAGPSRITLKAVKDCWIQVRDSDAAQTVVAQRTLRAGDTYRVPNRDGLVLRTGNATGLAVIVDDKPAPALGGSVRTVALDPARLLAGNAKVD